MRIGVHTNSLHECARRCYEYIFCYSITFDTTQRRPCIFYLHASDKCSGRQLTPIDTIQTDGPVTIECLKCMSESEAAALESTSTTTKKDENAPELEFSHDETTKKEVVSTTQAPVQNPKLVEEPKDELTKQDIEQALKSKPTPSAAARVSGCVVTFQIDTKTPIGSLTESETATVVSANQCAYICYQNACSNAIYVPNADEGGKSHCQLVFRGKEICLPHRQRHYSYKTEKAVILSCFRCDNELPSTISNEAELTSTTTAGLVEVTKITTAEQPTVTVTQGLNLEATTPSVGEISKSESEAPTPTKANEASTEKPEVKETSLPSTPPTLAAELERSTSKRPESLASTTESSETSSAVFVSTQSAESTSTKAVEIGHSSTTTQAETETSKINEQEPTEAGITTTEKPEVNETSIAATPPTLAAELGAEATSQSAETSSSTSEAQSTPKSPEIAATTVTETAQSSTIVPITETPEATASKAEEKETTSTSISTETSTSTQSSTVLVSETTIRSQSASTLLGASSIPVISEFSTTELPSKESTASNLLEVTPTLPSESTSQSSEVVQGHEATSAAAEVTSSESIQSTTTPETVAESTRSKPESSSTIVAEQTTMGLTQEVTKTESTSTVSEKTSSESSQAATTSFETTSEGKTSNMPSEGSATTTESVKSEETTKPQVEFNVDNTTSPEALVTSQPIIIMTEESPKAESTRTSTETPETTTIFGIQEAASTSKATESSIIQTTAPNLPEVSTQESSPAEGGKASESHSSTTATSEIPIEELIITSQHKAGVEIQVGPTTTSGSLSTTPSEILSTHSEPVSTEAVTPSSKTKSSEKPLESTTLLEEEANMTAIPEEMIVTSKNKPHVELNVDNESSIELSLTGTIAESTTAGLTKRPASTTETSVEQEAITLSSLTSAISEAWEAFKSTTSSIISRVASTEETSQTEPSSSGTTKESTKVGTESTSSPTESTERGTTTPSIAKIEESLDKENETLSELGLKLEHAQEKLNATEEEASTSPQVEEVSPTEGQETSSTHLPASTTSHIATESETTAPATTIPETTAESTMTPEKLFKPTIPAEVLVPEEKSTPEMLENEASTAESLPGSTSILSTTEKPIEEVQETLTGINKTLETLDKALEKINEKLNETQTEEAIIGEKPNETVSTTVESAETTTPSLKSPTTEQSSIKGSTTSLSSETVTAQQVEVTSTGISEANEATKTTSKIEEMTTQESTSTETKSVTGGASSLAPEEKELAESTTAGMSTIEEVSTTMASASKVEELSTTVFENATTVIHGTMNLPEASSTVGSKESEAPQTSVSPEIFESTSNPALTTVEVKTAKEIPGETTSGSSQTSTTSQEITSSLKSENESSSTTPSVSETTIGLSSKTVAGQEKSTEATVTSSILVSETTQTFEPTTSNAKSTTSEKPTTSIEPELGLVIGSKVKQEPSQAISSTKASPKSSENPEGVSILSTIGATEVSESGPPIVVSSTLQLTTAGKEQEQEASTTEKPLEAVQETLTSINSTLESLDEALEHVAESLNATKEESEGKVGTTQAPVASSAFVQTTVGQEVSSSSQPIESTTSTGLATSPQEQEVVKNGETELTTSNPPTVSESIASTKVIEHVETTNQSGPPASTTNPKASSLALSVEPTTSAIETPSTSLILTETLSLGSTTLKTEALAESSQTTERHDETKSSTEQTVTSANAASESNETTLVSLERIAPGVFKVKEVPMSHVEEKATTDAGSTSSPAEGLGTTGGRIVSETTTEKPIEAARFEGVTGTETSLPNNQETTTLSNPSNMETSTLTAFEPQSEKTSATEKVETTTKEELGAMSEATTLPSSGLSASEAFVSTATVAETEAASPTVEQAKKVTEVPLQESKTEATFESTSILATSETSENSITSEKLEEVTNSRISKIKEFSTTPASLSAQTTETPLASTTGSKSEEVVLEVAAKINKTIAEEAEKLKEKVKEAQEALVDVLTKINNTLAEEETLDKVEEALISTTTNPIEGSSTTSTESSTMKEETSASETSALKSTSLSASATEEWSTSEPETTFSPLEKSENESDEGLGLMIELKSTEKPKEKSTGIPFMPLENAESTTPKIEEGTTFSGIEVSLPSKNESWEVEQHLVENNTSKLNQEATTTLPETLEARTGISEAVNGFSEVSTPTENLHEATTLIPEIPEATIGTKSATFSKELAESHEVTTSFPSATTPIPEILEAKSRHPNAKEATNGLTEVSTSLPEASTGVSEVPKTSRKQAEPISTSSSPETSTTMAVKRNASTPSEALPEESEVPQKSTSAIPEAEVLFEATSLSVENATEPTKTSSKAAAQGSIIQEVENSQEIISTIMPIEENFSTTQSIEITSGSTSVPGEAASQPSNIPESEGDGFEVMTQEILSTTTPLAEKIEQVQEKIHEEQSKTHEILPELVGEAGNETESTSSSSRAEEPTTEASTTEGIIQKSSLKPTEVEFSQNEPSENVSKPEMVDIPLPMTNESWRIEQEAENVSLVNLEATKGPHATEKSATVTSQQEVGSTTPIAENAAVSTSEKPSETKILPAEASSIQTSSTPNESTTMSVQGEAQKTPIPTAPANERLTENSTASQTLTTPISSQEETTNGSKTTTEKSTKVPIEFQEDLTTKNENLATKIPEQESSLSTTSNPETTSILIAASIDETAETLEEEKQNKTVIKGPAQIETDIIAPAQEHPSTSTSPESENTTKEKANGVNKEGSTGDLMVTAEVEQSTTPFVKEARLESNLSSVVVTAESKIRPDMVTEPQSTQASENSIKPLEEVVTHTTSSFLQEQETTTPRSGSETTAIEASHEPENDLASSTIQSSTTAKGQTAEPKHNMTSEPSAFVRESESPTESTVPSPQTTRLSEATSTEESRLSKTVVPVEEMLPNHTEPPITSTSILETSHSTFETTTNNIKVLGGSIEEITAQPTATVQNNKATTEMSSSPPSTETLSTTIEAITVATASPSSSVPSEMNLNISSPSFEAQPTSEATPSSETAPTNATTEGPSVIDSIINTIKEKAHAIADVGGVLSNISDALKEESETNTTLTLATTVALESTTTMKPEVEEALSKIEHELEKAASTTVQPEIPESKTTMKPEVEDVLSKIEHELEQKVSTTVQPRIQESTTSIEPEVKNILAEINEELHKNVTEATEVPTSTYILPETTTISAESKSSTSQASEIVQTSSTGPRIQSTTQEIIIPPAAISVTPAQENAAVSSTAPSSVTTVGSESELPTSPVPEASSSTSSSESLVTTLKTELTSSSSSRTSETNIEGVSSTTIVPEIQTTVSFEQGSVESQSRATTISSETNSPVESISENLTTAEQSLTPEAIAENQTTTEIIKTTTTAGLKSTTIPVVGLSSTVSAQIAETEESSTPEAERSTTVPRSSKMPETEATIVPIVMSENEQASNETQTTAPSEKTVETVQTSTLFSEDAAKKSTIAIEEIVTTPISESSKVQESTQAAFETSSLETSSTPSTTIESQKSTTKFESVTTKEEESTASTTTENFGGISTTRSGSSAMKETEMSSTSVRANKELVTTTLLPTTEPAQNRSNLVLVGDLHQPSLVTTTNPENPTTVIATTLGNLEESSTHSETVEMTTQPGATSTSMFTENLVQTTQEKLAEFSTYKKLEAESTMTQEMKQTTPSPEATTTEEEGVDNELIIVLPNATKAENETSLPPITTVLKVETTTAPITTEKSELATTTEPSLTTRIIESETSTHAQEASNFVVTEGIQNASSTPSILEGTTIAVIESIQSTSVTPLPEERSSSTSKAEEKAEVGFNNDKEALVDVKNATEVEIVPLGIKEPIGEPIILENVTIAEVSGITTSRTPSEETSVPTEVSSSTISAVSISQGETILESSPNSNKELTTQGTLTPEFQESTIREESSTTGNTNMESFPIKKIGLEMTSTSTSESATTHGDETSTQNSKENIAILKAGELSEGQATQETANEVVSTTEEAIVSESAGKLATVQEGNTEAPLKSSTRLEQTTQPPSQTEEKVEASTEPATEQASSTPMHKNVAILALEINSTTPEAPTSAEKSVNEATSTSTPFEANTKVVEQSSTLEGQKSSTASSPISSPQTTPSGGENELLATKAQPEAISTKGESSVPTLSTSPEAKTGVSQTSIEGTFEITSRSPTIAEVSQTASQSGGSSPTSTSSPANTTENIPLVIVGSQKDENEVASTVGSTLISEGSTTTGSVQILESLEANATTVAGNQPVKIVTEGSTTIRKQETTELSRTTATEAGIESSTTTISLGSQENVNLTPPTSEIPHASESVEPSTVTTQEPVSSSSHPRIVVISPISAEKAENGSSETPTEIPTSSIAPEDRTSTNVPNTIEGSTSGTKVETELASTSTSQLENVGNETVTTVLPKSKTSTEERQSSSTTKAVEMSESTSTPAIPIAVIVPVTSISIEETENATTSTESSLASSESGSTTKEALIESTFEATSQFASETAKATSVVPAEVFQQTTSTGLFENATTSEVGTESTTLASFGQTTVPAEATTTTSTENGSTTESVLSEATKENIVQETTNEANVVPTEATPITTTTPASSREPEVLILSNGSMTPSENVTISETGLEWTTLVSPEQTTAQREANIGEVTTEAANKGTSQTVSEALQETTAPSAEVPSTTISSKETASSEGTKVFIVPNDGLSALENATSSEAGFESTTVVSSRQTAAPSEATVAQETTEVANKATSQATPESDQESTVASTNASQIPATEQSSSEIPKVLILSNEDLVPSENATTSETGLESTEPSTISPENVVIQESSTVSTEVAQVSTTEKASEAPEFVTISNENLVSSENSLTTETSQGSTNRTSSSPIIVLSEATVAHESTGTSTETSQTTNEQAAEPKTSTGVPKVLIISNEGIARSENTTTESTGLESTTPSSSAQTTTLEASTKPIVLVESTVSTNPTSENTQLEAELTSSASTQREETPSVIEAETTSQVAQASTKSSSLLFETTELTENVGTTESATIKSNQENVSESINVPIESTTSSQTASGPTHLETGSTTLAPTTAAEQALSQSSISPETTESATGSTTANELDKILAQVQDTLQKGQEKVNETVGETVGEIAKTLDEVHEVLVGTATEAPKVESTPSELDDLLVKIDNVLSNKTAVSEATTVPVTTSANSETSGQETTTMPGSITSSGQESTRILAEEGAVPEAANATTSEAPIEAMTSITEPTTTQNGLEVSTLPEENATGLATEFTESMVTESTTTSEEIASPTETARPEQVANVTEVSSSPEIAEAENGTTSSLESTTSGEVRSHGTESVLLIAPLGGSANESISTTQPENATTTEKPEATTTPTFVIENATIEVSSSSETSIPETPIKEGTTTTFEATTTPTFVIENATSGFAGSSETAFTGTREIMATTTVGVQSSSGASTAYLVSENGSTTQEPTESNATESVLIIESLGALNNESTPTIEPENSTASEITETTTPIFVIENATVELTGVSESTVPGITEILENATEGSPMTSEASVDNPALENATTAAQEAKESNATESVLVLAPLGGSAPESTTTEEPGNVTTTETPESTTTPTFVIENATIIGASVEEATAENVVKEENVTSATVAEVTTLKKEESSSSIPEPTPTSLATENTNLTEVQSTSEASITSGVTESAENAISLGSTTPTVLENVTEPAISSSSPVTLETLILAPLGEAHKNLTEEATSTAVSETENTTLAEITLTTIAVAETEQNGTVESIFTTSMPVEESTNVPLSSTQEGANATESVLILAPLGGQENATSISEEAANATSTVTATESTMVPETSTQTETNATESVFIIAPLGHLENETQTLEVPENVTSTQSTESLPESSTTVKLESTTAEEKNMTESELLLAPLGDRSNETSTIGVEEIENVTLAATMPPETATFTEILNATESTEEPIGLNGENATTSAEISMSLPESTTVLIVPENATTSEESNETSTFEATTLTSLLNETNITEPTIELVSTTPESPVSKKIRPDLLAMPPLRSGSTQEPEEELSSTTVPEIVKAVSQLLDNIRRETTQPPTTTEEITTIPTTTEPPVEAVSHLIDTLIGRPKDFESLLATTTTTEVPTTLKVEQTPYNDCSNGTLMFSARVMHDFTQPFEMVLNVFTVQECVRICNDLQCTGAAFTRFPRPTCLLHVNHESMPLAGMCPDAEVQSLYTEWHFESIPEVVQFDCIKCVESSDDGPINITHFKKGDVVRELRNPQGITTKCPGRVEFQVMPVNSVPSLNTSNDVPASSPADCARICFETLGCQLAGFMPNTHGDGSNGVCLLTTDPGICSNDNESRPQHGTEGTFLISCIKCSSCKYSISPVTEETKVEAFEEFSFAFSMGQCAEECHKNKCTMAEYNPSTLICSMSTTSRKEPKCLREIAVDTFGNVPLLLDCVDCAS